MIERYFTLNQLFNKCLILYMPSGFPKWGNRRNPTNFENRISTLMNIRNIIKNQAYIYFKQIKYKSRNYESI